jgi:hypothetical protein
MRKTLMISALALASVSQVLGAGHAKMTKCFSLDMAVAKGLCADTKGKYAMCMDPATTTGEWCEQI